MHDIFFLVRSELWGFMGFWILEIAWTFGIGSTSHKKRLTTSIPRKMMGEWEKFFTLHCYLLHQRNSSFPGKMQSRKINRLEAEEDLVEVVYRVCDGKKYTQIFLKLSSLHIKRQSCFKVIWESHWFRLHWSKTPL